MTIPPIPRPEFAMVSWRGVKIHRCGDELWCHWIKRTADPRVKGARTETVRWMRWPDCAPEFSDGMRARLTAEVAAVRDGLTRER